MIAQYTEDLGNGITAVVTIDRRTSFARSTATRTKTRDYYNKQYIGGATLTVSFYYNGSTSRAAGASGAGSGSNGWSCGGQSTRTVGSTAYLSASLTRDGRTVPVAISLTCGANGDLS